MLEEASTVELVDAVLHERLDAAFVRSPGGGAPGLVLDAVLEEPMLAALPAGHPLARGHGGPLALPELAQEPFILYRRATGPGLYDAILAACRSAGFSPDVVQEAPRMPATLALVAAGLGVSVVPASMRRLSGEDIAYRALAGCPGLCAPLHLALRRHDLSPAVGRFRELVQAMARAQTGGATGMAGT
jgi:DNA-binding transcriptional LysR family regulator